VNSDSLVRIERLNYAIGGLLVIAAGLTQPRAIALGILVGVALTCVNFVMVRRLVFRATAEAAKGISSNRMMLMLPKMTLLMAAVALSLWFLPISAAAFAAGYSIFIVSILVESVHAALRPPTDTPPQ
jgi:ATP synthase I chain